MNLHERATITYIRAFLSPPCVFVDVGAHVGYYAAFAGRLVGRTGHVFAFEPHPVNYKLLGRNCRQMPQIKTINAAVSDFSGHTLLFEHSSSTSSHALTDLSGSGKSIPISKVSLDEWTYENGIRRIDVVLIDVEGHELSVLRGMRQIIANNANITIILEYCLSHRASRPEEINALLKEIYKMKLYVTCALGQTKKYAIPEYTSETNLRNRLADILNEEINGNHCNYVNIVARRL